MLTKYPPAYQKAEDKMLPAFRHVPLVGIEPTSQLPQSCVLSIERQGHIF